MFPKFVNNRQKALSETDNAGFELALEYLLITDVDSEFCTPNTREKPPDPTSEELPQWDFNSSLKIKLLFISGKMFQWGNL